MPLLARYTTDFDCGYETNWWYVIKDTPFDIKGLKAKRRYEINKGKKNFEVRKINPKEYAEELADVQIKAFSAYPRKYRPAACRKSSAANFEACASDKNSVVFGAFDLRGLLCGYAQILLSKGWCSLSVLKADPEKERLGINAALVAGVLENLPIGKDFYILDGARSINHETHFQDYLEKYFNFRKAYCKLHIRYNPRVAWLVKALYPFRGFLLKFDGYSMIHKINSVMKMERFVRDNGEKREENP